MRSGMFMKTSTRKWVRMGVLALVSLWGALGFTSSATNTARVSLGHEGAAADSQRTAIPSRTGSWEALFIAAWR
jgi:hypothetical protein